MAGTGRTTPKEFAARLEVLCSDAQGEVREASRRVVRSLKKEEEPGRSDLALVLLHVAFDHPSFDASSPSAPPPAKTSESQVVGPPARREPIGRPRRSPFADRIREQEVRSDGILPEEDAEIRRRFGVSSDEQGRRRRQEDK